ncbi:MAG: hypothetical protein QNJ88_01425 [Acidimicrobiia bacterium]|nr:hypothetical protein [Acidimicrobiia bacterium]
MTIDDRAFERLRLANPAPVTVIEDRPAAAVALAVIQDREVGELERLTPVPARQRRRWVIPVVVAVVVALLVGLPTLLSNRVEEIPPATDPAPPTTSARFDPNATELIGPSRVVQGPFLVEQVGTPFSITFEAEWVFGRSQAGFVEFSESATDGGSDGTLVFIRATELSDPEQPTQPIELGDGIAATELETWLIDTEGKVTVSGRVETEIGGRPAIRFDLALPDGADCGPGAFCSYFVTSRGIADVGLNLGTSYRVWWIDEPGLDPIVVVASGSSALFGKVADVLVTLGFGPAAPHPIPALRPWEAGARADAPAGVVRIPSLGGLEFELAEPASLDPDDVAVQVMVSSVSEVTVSYAFDPITRDPLASVDEALQLLTPAVESFVEVEWSRAWNGGRAFDLVRGPDFSPLLAVESDGGLQWGPPANGRIWLFETERGLLFISAGSLEGTFGLERVITFGERIAETIELIEFP